MSNRRVKSLDYDDDDLEYDDDEYAEPYDQGQEEVSPEDKEQLRLGTIEVRKILGGAYQPTDTEIQDALWNYYYDIGKTVTFIKSTDNPRNTKALNISATNANQIRASQRLLLLKNHLVSFPHPSRTVPYNVHLFCFGRVRSDLSFDQINLLFQHVTSSPTVLGVKFQNIERLSF